MRRKAGVAYRSYEGAEPEGNSPSVASIPTTFRATVGPVGLGSAPVALATAENCERA